MHRASRVQLAPPGAWDEEQLLAAARAVVASGRPVHPGDALGDMIVVGVEPKPGAAMLEDTEIVFVPSPPRADADVVDIVVLLDTSESMALPWDAHHTRLEAARASLAAFLLSPGAAVASVALFEFAREPRLVAAPAPPGEIHLGAAPTPKGRCATAAALDAALVHVAARLTPERSNAIILLTDSVGEVADLLACAERAGRLRAPVHSLVFAPETDEVFEELSHLSGGSFQRATYPLTIEFEHRSGGA